MDRNWNGENTSRVLSVTKGLVGQEEGLVEKIPISLYGKNAPREHHNVTTCSHVGIGTCISRQFRSASTSDLVVGLPPTRRVSIRDRAFAVAGPRSWKSLPPALHTASKSLSSFKKELQSFLFGLSISLWQREHWPCSALYCNSSYRIIALNKLF